MRDAFTDSGMMVNNNNIAIAVDGWIFRFSCRKLLRIEFNEFMFFTLFETMFAIILFISITMNVVAAKV